MVLGSILTTTVTTLYTASLNNEIIAYVSFYNFSATPQTVSLYIVPSGGTPDDSNKLGDFQVNPGDTIPLNGMAIPLGTGDYIAASASADNSVNALLGIYKQA